MFGDLGVNDFSVPDMLLFDLAGAFSGSVYSGTFVLATLMMGLVVLGLPRRMK